MLSKKKLINRKLLNIFTGEEEGAEKEKQKLKEIKKQLKENIYREILLVLTNQNIENPLEAKQIYNKILSHKKKLQKKLQRDVGLEISALDYYKNIIKKINNPVFIEQSAMDKIMEQITYDNLTGLYGKELLEIDINHEIERFFRYAEPFSIMFIDIDNFKSINDIYGHLTGDHAIKFISDCIQKFLRKVDGVYAYDGDNFAVVLPETKLKEATKVGLKLREYFKNKDFDEIKKTFTLSIGIASFGNFGINNKNDLFEKATQALFQAKNLGKNKICIFRNEIYEIKTINDFSPINKKKRIEINGLTSGIVYKLKDQLSKEVDYYDISDEDLEEEIQRIHIAFKNVRDDLQETIENSRNQIGKKELDIFAGHKMILSDKILIQQIETELKKRKINAEIIIRDVFQIWQKKFEQIVNEIFRERANDIDDIKKKVIAELIGIEINMLEHIPQNSIIFTKNLMPSDTVYLNKKNINAIVTFEGGRNSHSAILARSLGIPYISKINKKVESIPNGSNVIINGEIGNIIISPNPNDYKLFNKKNNKIINNITLSEEKIDLSYNGEKINIYANVSSKESILKALSFKCKGIGIYKIEKFYMSMKTMPTEEELLEEFLKTLSLVKHEIVTIRLLDIGVENKIPYIDFENKNNPALGVRGIRLLFEYPQLLETQISALLRLSEKHKIKILIPMVTMVNEIVKVKK